MKRTMDLAITVVLLIATAPLLLLTVVLVKLTSKGPVIYSQARTGRGRRRFTIYKIRTMYHDCERHTGPRWSTANDPRVTPLGRFLRKSHLDELPQLWNILKGEMSLIGPRPERPEIIVGLEKALPRYGERLAVRPGVTGLAQVNLPPDTDRESVRRKLVLDLLYIETRGPWLDLRIAISTGLFMAGIPFASTTRLLGIRPVGVDLGPAPPSGARSRNHEPAEVGMVAGALPAWPESCRRSRPG